MVAEAAARQLFDPQLRAKQRAKAKGKSQRGIKRQRDAAKATAEAAAELRRQLGVETRNAQVRHSVLQQQQKQFQVQQQQQQQQLASSAEDGAVSEAMKLQQQQQQHALAQQQLQLSMAEAEQAGCVKHLDALGARLREAEETAETASRAVDVAKSKLKAGEELENRWDVGCG